MQAYFCVYLMVFSLHFLRRISLNIFSFSGVLRAIGVKLTVVLSLAAFI